MLTGTEIRDLSRLSPARAWIALGFDYPISKTSFARKPKTPKVMTEHAGYKPDKDQRVNARTVINPVQTWVFAPHHVHYHIEHHVYPGYGKILRELVR